MTSMDQMRYFSAVNPIRDAVAQLNDLRSIYNDPNQSNVRQLATAAWGGAATADLRNLPSVRELESITRAISLSSRLGIDDIQRLGERFILPQRSALIDAVQSARSIGQSIQPLLAVSEKMTSRWLDRERIAQSVSSLASLSRIGQQIANASPFGDDVVHSLRQNLGNWSHQIEWPSEIFNDLTARSAFYKELGYDRALTELPEEAFEESLEVTGISTVTPQLYELYGEPLPTSDDDAFDVSYSRTNKAHDWLMRFEIQLRRFINLQMEKEFGANWPKTQLHANKLKEWKYKKEQYELKGGTVGYPLIDFADFTDYIDIICRKDNFERVFKQFFHRSESFRESFQRLFPIRIDTMHARVITQDDELLLYVEIKRLAKAWAT